MTPPLPETDPAQAHLLSLGQVSPVAIFRANAAGECVYVNERWTEITGISTTDSLGSGWARAIHPDDRARIAEAWARAPSLQEFFQAECRIERDDGLRWVIAQAVPVLEDGAVTGFLGSVTDITSLKATEQALRQEKERSEGIIRCSVDGILAFDRDCRYTVWNPGMELISGVAADDVIGRIAFDVFPFLKEIGEDRFFHGALAGEFQTVRDRPFKIPTTGREGFFDGQYGPLRDGDGAVIGGLGVIKDITDHKAALDALRAAQSRVVQASKLTAMGELGAAVAHELNQPLSGIKMLVALMRADPTQTIGHYAAELDLIAAQVDRMAGIVDNVRAFARESEFVPGVTEPLGSLTKTLMLMSEQLRQAEVLVERRFAPDLPPIQADPVRLQQVFLNLISNALHGMTSSTERRLILGVERIGDRVYYRIEDTGSGVPAEVVPRMFEPFFSTKEVGTGTGLGLSIVYGIVEEHGGSIRYEPAPSGGAAFVVSIPVASVDVLAPDDPPPPPLAEADPTQRILVVDDEQTLRRALDASLTHLGFPHTITANAADALRALEAESFDVALVDLKMPGMSGFELCAALRASHPKLQLIAMSGFVTDETREQLLAIGVAAVLPKPFGPDELEILLARLTAA